MLCGLTLFLSLLYGRDLRRRSTLLVELARLSRTDAPTGLPNRRRFDEVSERAWKSAATGKPLSLLLVDADHFKSYNDRHGRAVGDEVLKGIVRCLSASVQRSDDLMARVGGKEFVLLLADTDEGGAYRIARKVHHTGASLGRPPASIGVGNITVSIGLAVDDGSAGYGKDVLYRRVDAALFEAKATGRNQTCRAPASGKRQGRNKAAA